MKMQIVEVLFVCLFDVSSFFFLIILSLFILIQQVLISYLFYTC